MGKAKTFTTRGLSQAASLKAWRNYMSEVYYNLDIVAHSDGLLGSLSEAALGSIFISRFEADAQRVVRTKAAAKLDGSDDYVFLFPKKQPLVFRQRHLEGRIEPGNVVVLSSAEKYEVDVPDGSANVTLKIPRSYLQPRIAWLDDLVGHDNATDQAIVPLVRDVAERLFDIDHDRDNRLQSICLDLIAVMVESNKRSFRGLVYGESFTELVVAKTIEFIKNNYHRPDLSVESAASYLNISERYLQKMLKRNEMTFTGALMDIRLDAARSLLQRNAGGRRLQIGQIAFACGFRSQSHFATCFRARYGHTPREAFQGVD